MGNIELKERLKDIVVPGKFYAVSSPSECFEEGGWSTGTYYFDRVIYIMCTKKDPTIETIYNFICSRIKTLEELQEGYIINKIERYSYIENEIFDYDYLQTYYVFVNNHNVELMSVHELNDGYVVQDEYAYIYPC